jgi:hypothetical protein
MDCISASTVLVFHQHRYRQKWEDCSPVQEQKSLIVLNKILDANAYQYPGMLKVVAIGAIK